MNAVFVNGLKLTSPKKITTRYHLLFFILHYRLQILQQLRQDAAFLGRLGIVDYRLFVGVHMYLDADVTPFMRKLLRRCSWDHSSRWSRFEGGLLSTVTARAAISTYVVACVNLFPNI